MTAPKKAVAAHSKKAQSVALKATPEGRAVKVATKLPVAAKKIQGAKHRATGQGKRDAQQVANSSKGLVAFGASKTRSGFKSSFDNPMAPKQKPKKSVVTYRHMIAAEFWVGLLIILFEDVTEEPDNQTESKWVQLAAFIVTWAILFGITATGTGGAKFAAALGGLILLTIMLKKGSPFEMLKVFSDKAPKKGKLDRSTERQEQVPEGQ